MPLLLADTTRIGMPRSLRSKGRESQCICDDKLFRACGIGSIVPALAKNARTGHPRFWLGREIKQLKGSATRPLAPSPSQRKCDTHRSAQRDRLIVQQIGFVPPLLHSLHRGGNQLGRPRNRFQFGDRSVCSNIRAHHDGSLNPGALGLSGVGRVYSMNQHSFGYFARLRASVAWLAWVFREARLALTIGRIERRSFWRRRLLGRRPREGQSEARGGSEKRRRKHEKHRTGNHSAVV